jgi:di/tricarboxylate transporter
MTTTQILLIVVVAIPLILVGLNRLRVDVAALIIALALGTLQYLDFGILGRPDTPFNATRAVAGFSQPVVLTLLSLFIITRALDKVGLTRWIAQHILKIGGQSEQRLIALFATATALLSLFMNNLAAGALLLPSAMETARRSGIRPSKLLIPVAYGSLLGGVATYFTTANIIVSDLLTTANPPQAPLHILDFTATGGLIAIAGILFLSLFGKRLLPDRPSSPEQLMARHTGSELEDFYQLNERLWEARVLKGSPFIGQTLAATGIGERLGLAVAAIWHNRQATLTPKPQQIIQRDDILLVVGREDRVEQLTQLGCSIGHESDDGHFTKHVSPQGVSFIEVMPAPHSEALGQSLKSLEFRSKYGFTAVALLREGRSYRTDVADFNLKLGDSLLIVGPRNRLKTLQNTPEFIVLEPAVSDQPLERRPALFTVGVMLTAIAVSIIGFPIHLAMLAGALLVVLAGILTMEEAYRSVEWQAIFLIAGMYTVSLAMVKTSLADLIGGGMVGLVTPLGPIGLAAGAYLLSSLLTQFMGGQVTALVTGPIAISAALTLHVNPQAVAVATAIGCSASFFSPVAHPVNILMIGPANYHFSDFFRVGWRLTIICFVMLIIGMLLFWHL